MSYVNLNEDNVLENEANLLIVIVFFPARWFHEIGHIAWATDCVTTHLIWIQLETNPK